MEFVPGAGTVLPLFCAPPVSWFRLWVQNRLAITIDLPYQKQHYFNRFYILGANAVLMNTIPVRRHSASVSLAEVEISVEQNWPLRLARTFRFSYAGSAFYEHYWPAFAPVIEHPPRLLAAFNISVLQVFASLLQLREPVIVTESCGYQVVPRDSWDSRRLVLPPQPKYFQLFGDKFHPELSIFDGLFNLGPDLVGYLNSF